MNRELRIFLMCALAGVFFLRFGNQLSTLGKVGWAIFIVICILVAWKNDR